MHDFCAMRSWDVEADADGALGGCLEAENAAAAAAVATE